MVKGKPGNKSASEFSGNIGQWSIPQAPDHYMQERSTAQLDGD